MQVHELAPGLWRWSAGAAWCYYVETPGTTLLIDPLVPPDEPERFWRALDRDVARRGLPVIVVLTRAGQVDAAEIVERYGAQVFGPDELTPAAPLPRASSAGSTRSRA